MSFRLAAAALMLVVASGLPSPSSADAPVRVLPYSWLFNITALSGPGCPDFGVTSPPFVTRPTYGENTMDGSEIYYWYIAYPHLRASVGPGTPTATTWCETTLTYTELDQSGNAVADPQYRLRLHKNGTAMLAKYDLDDGVRADWKFTYYPSGGDQVVDTINIAGPRSSSVSADRDASKRPEDALMQWVLPQCGTGTIKFKTELTVTSNKDGAAGSVTSEKMEYNGKIEYYGAQQGFSYDWEYC